MTHDKIEPEREPAEVVQDVAAFAEQVRGIHGGVSGVLGVSQKIADMFGDALREAGWELDVRLPDNPWKDWPQ